MGGPHLIEEMTYQTPIHALVRTDRQTGFGFSFFFLGAAAGFRRMVRRWQGLPQRLGWLLKSPPRRAGQAPPPLRATLLNPCRGRNQKNLPQSKSLPHNPAKLHCTASSKTSRAIPSQTSRVLNQTGTLKTHTLFAYVPWQGC